MDNKGFISIEYLFSIFIILLIAIGLLFFSQSAIESSNNIEDSIESRLILDSVANSITQVNSNGEGYSKIIKLPYASQYYTIEVQKDKLTIEKGNKKGETSIPLVIMDSKYKLHGGKSYLIEKNDKGKIVIK